MEYYVNEQMKHLNLLTSELDKAYHEAALKLGLSDSVMLILYTLCWCEGECLLGDLTSSASKQTINSALRKLEADGIVRLETFRGRKKKVRLTDKGEQYVKDTVYPIIRIENEISDSWSEEEKNTYIELTRRYLEAFREKLKEV
ncbi:MAG: MarR family transcriptional regulator [Lachnospiraceae bacterium]|jgi:DNA-binding MarR family transcriptional regulator|nr:MarR family transcriptional regulator [Lachnospiraceae bacterium]MCI9150300.1 MarR family transcriptional regulator [Lachnospiraceae bacterium]